MRILLLALVLVAAAGSLPAHAADGVPAYTDLLADCAKSKDPACAGEQAVLAPQWPKALSGDLFSLRNFAFCLGNGCYGALRIDPVRACALRIVVAAIGDQPVSQEDRNRFNQDCGQLGADDQQAAKVAARDMVRTIRRANP